MRKFVHVKASSPQEAAQNAARGNAVVIAGGTDLLGTLKDEILPQYPAVVIDLKGISGMDAIEDKGDYIQIGALTKLSDIADSELIKKECEALSDACSRAATPAIRSMGTISGNVCQLHRCWYFRSPDNRFPCARKGGKTCYAVEGDNRYHSIMGNVGGCVAASTQETAPVLVALGATIITTARELSAEEFFVVNGARSCAVEDGEIVTAIRVPKAEGSAYEKFALRKAVDFPLVNCAVAYTEQGGLKIALGGVAPTPVRVVEAEAAVTGGISEKTAAAAAAAAAALCTPLSGNVYKVEIMTALIKRTLLKLV